MNDDARQGLAAVPDDPDRLRILRALSDGRAYTGRELAVASGLAPEPAGAHLEGLALAGLVRPLRSGRHVYFRLADDGAAVLETAAGGGEDWAPCHRRKGGPASEALMARTCYTHIAGRLGVRMFERLVALRVLALRGDVVATGPRYPAFCRTLSGEVLPEIPRRPVVRLCLDWSERRYHLSGGLARRILQVALENRWLERRAGSRALAVTPDGADAFARLLGLDAGTLGAEVWAREIIPRGAGPKG